MSKATELHSLLTLKEEIEHWQPSDPTHILEKAAMLSELDQERYAAQSLTEMLCSRSRVRKQFYRLKSILWEVERTKPGHLSIKRISYNSIPLETHHG